MKHSKWLVNGLLALASFLLSLSLAELGIRQFGEYDLDGNFIVDHYGTIRPYHLPVMTTQQKVETYLQRADEAIIIYDPQLGWTLRPNSQSENGFYRYNSDGIRSTPVEYPRSPREGILRIALFGDSFTHGDEVPFEESWGYYLEQGLNQAGIPNQVLNFGVNGYGMDQAFLRWQTLGIAYQPDLVILGLQMENVSRNVNLVRPIYRRSTGLPFSKPRFILSENDDLQRINQPTVPPTELPELLQNFAFWEFAKHEAFYQPENYQTDIWLNSKFVAFLLDIISVKPNEDQISYALNDEPAQITLAIIEQFEQSVMAQQAHFLVVHLPRERHLETLLAGKTLPYDDMLEVIETNYKLIRPEIKRLTQADNLSLDPLFVGSHYSALGNQLVAEEIINHLVVYEFD